MIGTALLVGVSLVNWFIEAKHRGDFKAGNSKHYHLKYVEALKDSPLKGKKIIFLGSSVTEGAHAKGTSFVDYIAKRHGIDYIKEAVSGTTLVNQDASSYVERLKTIDPTYPADLFVCQLSTNDASQGFPLGQLSKSFDQESFDTSTITGAIENIIAYASRTWQCPIVFYTGTQYDNDAYDQMVMRLHDIKEKWGIDIIDLWHEESMQDIGPDQRALYMNDLTVHPTKAGYRDWWTPVIEKGLYKHI